MKISVIGVIPARLGSTRLQEKVLRPIAGRPMIRHVWERVKQARKLDEVIIACDDPRIEACAREFGARAVMTSAAHTTGSSRVAEAAARENAAIVINIQGDEPMIHPSSIDALAEVLLKNSQLDAATLAVPSRDPEAYLNPNVVKVVCDREGNALFFSRAPLPFYREGGKTTAFLKHLGIYGYRKDFLLKFVGWKPGHLEDCEKLEQLRILEEGFKIRVVETPHDSWSVDTLEDLRTVEEKIKQAVFAKTAGVV